MSTPTLSLLIPSSTPTNDPTSTNPDHNPTTTAPPTQYYNYLYLLLAFFILAALLLLIYHLHRRRRHTSLTRRHQLGRAALSRDVAGFPLHHQHPLNTTTLTDSSHRATNSSHAAPSPFFLWSQRPSSLYSLDEEQEGGGDMPGRITNPRRDEVVCEPGLDDRGEAPPPYGSAGTTVVAERGGVEVGKGGFGQAGERGGSWAMGRRWRREVGGGGGESGRGAGQVAPPGYELENRVQGEAQGGAMLPVRPAEVVIVAERAVDADVEAAERHSSRDPRRRFAWPGRTFR